MSDDLKTRTLGSLFWKFLERGGYHGIQLIVQIVLARILMPSDFGLLAILLVFINVGNVLVQSGLNTALIQAHDVDHRDASTVFWVSVALAGALYAAVYLISPAAAQWYDLPELVGALRILGLVLFAGAFNSIQVALASRRLDFKPIFLSTSAAVVLSGSLGIGMALLGYGYWALVAQQLSYQVVASVALAFSVAWMPRLEFNAARAKEFYAFGWRLCSASLIDTAYLGLYDLAVGKAFSRTTLGHFSQGKKFPATVNSLFDGTIQSVMLSTISRLQDRSERARHALRRSVTASTFVVAPVMGVMLLTAPSLVTVLLSEKWLAAVPFLQAFCILYVVQPVQTSNLQAISALGRSDIVLRINLLKRLLGFGILGLTVFVIRDAHAVAVGAVVDGYLAAAINASVSRRLLGYGLGDQIRDVLPAYLLTATSVGVAALATTALPVGIGKLLAQAALVVVSYGAVARILNLESFRYLQQTLVQYAGRRKNNGR